MSTDVVELLREPTMTRVCAPMVRYSKLQFRRLVRKYDCDLCFTPMILADSFVRSAKARNNEFTTDDGDVPLIVQFAAKTAEDFASAAEMVAPYCNGVDLNCGCPQRWAMEEGFGADLLNKPQLVKELIRQVRNRIPSSFTVSAKIRLSEDIRKTIELCRALEEAGASFLTVHARTREMRNEPIDLEGLKLVRDCIKVPVIANGNVKNLESARILCRDSKCNGVMVANGILTNPALFSGFPVTPLTCIQDWLDITSAIPTPFLCMHRHLVFMLEKILSKEKRKIFNDLRNKEAVFEFLQSQYGFKPKKLRESARESYDIWPVDDFNRDLKIKPDDPVVDDTFGSVFSGTW